MRSCELSLQSMPYTLHFYFWWSGSRQLLAFDISCDMSAELSRPWYACLCTGSNILKLKAIWILKKCVFAWKKKAMVISIKMFSTPISANPFTSDTNGQSLQAQMVRWGECVNHALSHPTRDGDYSWPVVSYTQNASLYKFVLVVFTMQWCQLSVSVSYVCVLLLIKHVRSSIKELQSTAISPYPSTPPNYVGLRWSGWQPAMDCSKVWSCDTIRTYWEPRPYVLAPCTVDCYQWMCCFFSRNWLQQLRLCSWVV